MRRRFEDDLSLRAALRELPERQPPAAAWEGIRARLEEGSESREPQPVARRRRVHMALAAGVVLAAIIALYPEVHLQRGGDPVPAEAFTTAGLAPAELAELVAESERLERTLVLLPRFDGVVRAGTASTIAGLEDHIAVIDAELSAGEALGADPRYRQALWRERVEIMNALVDVQYAQLPAALLFQ